MNNAAAALKPASARQDGSGTGCTENGWNTVLLSGAGIGVAFTLNSADIPTFFPAAAAAAQVLKPTLYQAYTWQVDQPTGIPVPMGFGIWPASKNPAPVNPVPVPTGPVFTKKA